MNSYIHSNNQKKYQYYVTYIFLYVYISIVFHLLPCLADDDAAWTLPEEKLWAVKMGKAIFKPSASVWLFSQIRCTMWRSQLKLIRALCHKTYANSFNISEQDSQKPVVFYTKDENLISSTKCTGYVYWCARQTQ